MDKTFFFHGNCTGYSYNCATICIQLNAYTVTNIFLLLALFLYTFYSCYMLSVAHKLITDPYASYSLLGIYFTTILIFICFLQLLWVCL